MSEEELIKKARRGKSEAFGALYDTYLPRIYRFVFLKTSGKEVTEDITHQTFLKAWQNIRQYIPKGFPFSSWLYRIAHNLVIDHYRAKKINIGLDSIEENELAFEPENKLDDNLAIAKIKSAIPELPQEQQTVIIMKFIEGLSNEEVAAALDKSEVTVRVLQHRAIKNLKNLTGENGKNNPKIKEA